MKKRKSIYSMAAILLAMSLMTGCSNNNNVSEDTATSDVSDSDQNSNEASTDLEQIDMSNWQYESDSDIYYQLGISYCANPVDTTYESMAVFVPGSYFTGTDNGDGTYTCELNTEAEVGGYTAKTAPIVIPVETPGYSACEALTKYQDFSTYTNAGFVYIHAGCRGRDAGAPAGITDLKAAIRYTRFNAEILPGDTDRIFSFGMSGGGAQSSLLGSTGDSSLYEPYLKAIGAVENVSDAVAGSMCWCPITNLDSADEAYEWNMGVTRSGLSDEEQKISDDLAAAFAEYINSAGFTDENGNTLTLDESEDGIYQAGTYYTYLKNVIETSLNHFLSDTTFPYDADSSNSGGMGRGNGGFGGRGDFDKKDDFPGGDNTDNTFPSFDQKGDFPNKVNLDNNAAAQDTDDDASTQDADTTNDTGEKNDVPAQDADSSLPDESKTGESLSPSDNNETAIYQKDNINRTIASGTVSLSGTYETAQDYIDALNADTTWVTYDAGSNTATITSIADFVKAFKTASKSLGAFDALDESQGENTLFGYGDGNGAHFDAVLAEILKGTDYESAYAEDLAAKDSEGNTVDVRLNMYTPLYYLMESYDGYQTANVAKYWRIRTGINQSDTALTTEVNLALALEHYDGVEAVDFETVWGQAHTEAERTGNSTENFINWVNECLQ